MALKYEDRSKNNNNKKVKDKNVFPHSSKANVDQIDTT